MLSGRFTDIRILLAGSSPIGNAGTRKEARSNNWYVRIFDADSIAAEGRLTRLGGDAVNIGRTRVVVAEMSSIERRVRAGGGWRTGALAGSLTATGLAVMAVLGLCYGECVVHAVAAGVLLGASAGAAVGRL